MEIAAILVPSARHSILIWIDSDNKVFYQYYNSVLLVKQNLLGQRKSLTASLSEGPPREKHPAGKLISTNASLNR
jgi:hypothetical protein